MIAKTKKLINSFKYAIEGIISSFKTERNMKIHIFIMILVIIAGIFFKISITEWLVLALIIGLVIATELINTSIEATIDLVTKETHPLAKIAKDTAAAAVLVFGLTAIVIGCIIFVPKILVLIGG